MKDFIIKENGDLCESNVFESETVTVPDGVVRICYAAFRFHGMRELTLPEGLQSITDSACEECRQLEKVHFPQSLREIGLHAFINCEALESVRLPDGLRKIGSCAFSGSGLEEIFLPRSVTTYASAFSYCERLKKVVLEEGSTYVDGSAFSGCSLLTEVVLPEGITEIRSYAFRQCTSLTSIVLPASVRSIEKHAFEGCTNLRRISLPEGLNTLGEDAFRGCDLLPPDALPAHLVRKKETPPPAVVEVASGADAFVFGVDGETVTGIRDRKAHYGTICVPDGVRVVRGAAFARLHVQNVILPDGVQRIGKGAFLCCVNFRRIYIPASVREIDRDAFEGCKMLQIYCEGEPQKGWLDKPDTRKVFYDDMTEAFNFHRSGGSFDDHHIVERVETIRNSYNPEKRPVHTGVSREEFMKISQEA